MPVNPWTLFSFPILSFFSLLILFPLKASSVNQQGQALLWWKGSLKEEPKALSNWDGRNETPCGWFGITCDSDSLVVELNLRYVDLFGPLPSNFSSLTSLNKLVLTGTNLTGSIPKEIGVLQDLSYLDLSDNALTGEIPSELCSLLSLEQLYLNSNSLEGSIPPQLGNLTSLTWLVLYDNQLSGAIPSSIGNLKKLEAIRGGGNKNLEGPLPEEIGNCTNLAMIGLAETSMSGFLPPSLGRLKKLQTLAIYTALLSGPIPHELGDCTQLQNIYLYENALTGSIPASLGSLRNLQNLLLWQNNLVGIIPPELGSCQELVVIDVSMNSLSGSVPETFGNLSSLQELQLSVNQLSGQIPTQIGNCLGLTHIELDNNKITGTIPSSIGGLVNLTLLYLWENMLEGNIPESISNCRSLEAVDFSENSLTGPIPKGIFQLKKLNKLLLLSNNLSGEIPREIGECSSLIRLRASNNNLAGSIPPQIGNLKNLNFLDLAFNRLTGVIPQEISGCQNLTFLDLHSNSIAGNLPENLNQLVSLQLVDVSDNMIEGTLSPNLGSLSSLTKLILRKNQLSGSIPRELRSCTKLVLLDLSSNHLTGKIPSSVGKIPALEIALNLSWNKLSGKIPVEFSDLDKLGVLDLSHNQLSGDLQPLFNLQNLVVLNISYNNFSGRVPDTPFFSKLPLSVLAGNPALCLSGDQCADDERGGARHAAAARVAMVVLLCAACALLLAALYIILGNKMSPRGSGGPHQCDSDSDVDMGPHWELTLYQKLDLSISEVARCLTAANVVGHGRSGVVYRANIPSGATIAVKRFRSAEKFSAAAFSSEIATLARIRHRNIVRLLGWAANRKTKLLFYDYLPCGTLGTLLHESNSAIVQWENRFNIALGVAEGLAYLHHDCVPPIIHRDVKAHNILLGGRYEACLADFGLARLVEDDSGNGPFSANPQFAGSYGYMAPGECLFPSPCVVTHTRILIHLEGVKIFHFGPGLFRLEGLDEKIPMGNPRQKHPAKKYQHHVMWATLFRLFSENYCIIKTPFLVLVLVFIYGHAIGLDSELIFGALMAAEYACMVKITEKSDVYSYGVVLLEIITGKKPVDPSFGEGQHVIQWVREQLKSKRDPVQILDPKLQGHPDTQIQEMLQALGISLLCTSTRAEDRPTMKDVAVLLREIRHDPSSGAEPHKPHTTTTTTNNNKNDDDQSNGSRKPEETPSFSSQLLFLQQGSPHYSLAYSSSSAGYNVNNDASV